MVLYPAITYPHKDHATLVAAFARALVDHPTAVLVLTGRADAAEAAVAEQIDRLGIAGRVRRLGRVPAADVAGLYDLATVVAVPSRYEGFGLPAAEAMAHGAPVVAADATALPEVVGDAGRLVAPGDVVAWGEALGEILGDPVLRQRLSEAGRVRSQGFGRAANAGDGRRLPRCAGLIRPEWVTPERSCSSSDPMRKRIGQEGAGRSWVRHRPRRRSLAPPAPAAVGCPRASPAASSSPGSSSW